MSKDNLLNAIKTHFGFDPKAGQLRLMEMLSDFVMSPEKDHLFILKGYAGTGKTTMVSALINSLSNVNFKSVLLAPTGRAAKVLALYSGKTAFTIHKKIYKAQTNKDGQGSFVLQANMHKNTIFIVDEASMIGDGSTPGDGKLLSNKSLLEDLMFYVYNGENCRLILIGDTAQLPPVGMNESPALDIEFMKAAFHSHISTFELTEVVRQTNDSGILHNATIIRNLIRSEEISYPKLQTHQFTDLVRVPGNELVEAINDAYRKYGDDNTMIICRSNKRANIYNREIRSRIKFHEESISTGDYLMVVKNNYYWLSSEEKNSFIANGDIAEIVRIKKRDINKFGFTFADVVLRLMDYPDEPEFEAKVILDTLAGETPALTYDQSNKLFNEVMAHYEEIKNKRARIQKVKQDPYFNALQVKFAYAVTCHKAQGGQWKAVFIEQGYLTDEMVNKEFKRWLYTGFTRAQEKLFLVNFSKHFFEDTID